MNWKSFIKDIATGALVGISAMLIVDGVEAVSKVVKKTFK